MRYLSGSGRWGMTSLAALAASAMLLLGPMPAQQTGVSESDVSQKSGYLLFSGGVVKGTAGRTQSSSWALSESPKWTNLPGAEVNRFVPLGTTDLFHVSFSAECILYGRSQDDFARIQVLDNGVPMEPTDGSQAFCASPATYTGNWVQRVSGGFHKITVQFLIVDNAPFANLGLTVDDWTLKLVVYD